MVPLVVVEMPVMVPLVVVVVPVMVMVKASSKLNSRSASSNPLPHRLMIRVNGIVKTVEGHAGVAQHVPRCFPTCIQMRTICHEGGGGGLAIWWVIHRFCFMYVSNFIA